MRRIDEWQNIDESAYLYHLSQWVSQKQSTKHFADFLGERLYKALRVIDLGCGAGAATFYLAKRSPLTSFTGIDYSDELISCANELAIKNKANNLIFKTGDWFKLEEKYEVDGVVSLQTLSWLPEFEKPLIEIFGKLHPNWLAVSSLFYEGDISCVVNVNEHARNKQSFYNVYSIPAVREFAEKHGYKLIKKSKFQIDIDIEKPMNSDSMGTYTLLICKDKGPDNERLQISGPLLMNWWFLLFEKIEDF